MMENSAQKFVLRGLALASLMLPMAAAASTTVSDEYHGDGRPFLVHLQDDTQSQHGGWEQGNQLRAYADQHTGNYIVFLAEGSLHRIDQADQLHEVEVMYEPMKELSRQQKALSQQQKPLSEQQRSLSAEMRSTSDSAVMRRVGAEQGEIGRAQGEIGRQQGVIGRQQGELGRKLFAHVQTLMDACLQNHSCPVVETAKP